MRRSYDGRYLPYVFWKPLNGYFGKHPGLHCSLILIQQLGTELLHNLENTICDPLSTQWAVLFQYAWENPSEYKELCMLTIEGL